MLRELLRHRVTRNDGRCHREPVGAAIPWRTVHEMTDDYFIGVHARELERLKAQHDAWKPESAALWHAAGFGSGQRIADFGSGPGFTALELATIVGPSGRVVALDKLRFISTFFARKRGGADSITCRLLKRTSPRSTSPLLPDRSAR